MMPRLTELWTQFLDEDLPIDEQQRLLDEVSRGAMPVPRPLADIEMHGLLAALGRSDDCSVHERNQGCEADELDDALPELSNCSDFTRRVMARLAGEHAEAGPELERELAPESKLPATTPMPVLCREPRVASRVSRPAARRMHLMGAVMGAVMGGTAAVLVIILAARLQPAPSPSPGATASQSARPSATPSATQSASRLGAPRQADVATQHSNHEGAPASHIASPNEPAPRTQDGKRDEGSAPPQVARHEPSNQSASESPREPAPEPQSSNNEPVVWAMLADDQQQPARWATVLPSHLQDETLQLVSGVARLSLKDVGEVTIEAPAEFRPESTSELFVNYGTVRARALGAKRPVKLRTAGGGIHVIEKALVIADSTGASIAAEGPVGVRARTGDAVGPMIAIPAGGYRWLSQRGQVHDWMVSLMEDEGHFTLVVNHSLLPVGPWDVRVVVPQVQRLVLQQLAETTAAVQNPNGALLIDGRLDEFNGSRGAMSAMRRLVAHLDRRLRWAVANNVPLTINGVTLPTAANKSPLIITSGGILPGAAAEAENSAAALLRAQMEAMRQTLEAGQKQLTEQLRGQQP
ncbi:MAG: hypothetical protein KDB14_22360 [Planctomycetales bacterium]|nr:hypothetical protein [Planctomycetales bacterium]